jgi:hypothetical protein
MTQPLTAPANGKTQHARPAPPVDIRHNCGRLLFRAVIPLGLYLEIRCPKCGRVHVVDTRLGPLEDVIVTA